MNLPLSSRHLARLAGVCARAARRAASSPATTEPMDIDADMAGRHRQAEGARQFDARTRPKNENGDKQGDKTGAIRPTIAAA